MNEDESGVEVAVEEDVGGGAEAEDANGEAERISALVVRCICSRYVYRRSVTFQQTSPTRCRPSLQSLWRFAV